MLKHSFKSFWFTFSIKLVIPSILGNTHSGIISSTSKTTDLGWLIVVGNVTAGFATFKVQVTTNLSRCIESPVIVARSTAHFSTRVRARTKDSCSSSASSSNLHLHHSSVTRLSQWPQFHKMRYNPGISPCQAIVGSADWTGRGAYLCLLICNNVFTICKIFPLWLYNIHKIAQIKPFS